VEESPRALSAAELTAADYLPDDEHAQPDKTADAVGFGAQAIPEQTDRRQGWR
jgi:DNA recombination protein RmuC